MQTRTKILIYLAVWKRPEITEMCFAGIERLKTHPDFDIDALAVISEESMIPLCEKYGVHYVEHENSPLGKKKNFGLQAARYFKFDFLMEIGSDDLVLNELLDVYKKFMVKYDFFGVRDAAFICSETGACRRVIGPTKYGAGRMISRAALDKIDFKLWKDNIERGLDNRSEVEMHKVGFRYWQIPPSEMPLVVDVKSDVNLWKFDHLTGQDYDMNLILEKLSTKEVKLLKQCLAVVTE